MPPFLRIYQGHPRQHILGTHFRFSAFRDNCWTFFAFLAVAGLATESLAQAPQTTTPSVTSVAATRLAPWVPASLPYVAGVTLMAIAFLIIFNLKLQRELRASKQAGKKLRTADRVKTELLDSMADSVFFMNNDQRIRWANRSARSTLKSKSETLLGQYCYAIWGDGEAPCKGCPVPQSLVTGNAQINQEIKGTEGRRWQVQSYPVKNDNGDLRGIVVISRDVTEALVKQEEQFKIHKLESVGILAGGIAHDFNNMLTAVMGYISLAELKQAGNAETKAYLQKATAAADRAKQLAARLLTFSQGGYPIRRQVGVEKLITKVIANTSEKHVRIRKAIAPRCGFLWCDPDQILQAVKNVIANACESMPTGGEVLVKADCTHIEADFDALLLPGDYLRIDICDRGPGIPATIAGKIFDPYFTTKPMGAEKGSGLGLAITHSIVRKHQGYVSVAERPGGGTTVNILLPLDAVDPHKAEAPVLAKVKKPSQKGERILVLEDEAVVGDMAKMLLSHLGYRVTHTSQGKAAVDQFKAAQAAGDPYSAVILDLTIKGGMGGRETLEALKRYDPGVRAFVSSGYSSDPVLTNFRSYGFSGVIPKPYTLKEVKRALAIASEPTETSLFA